MLYPVGSIGDQDSCELNYNRAEELRQDSEGRLLTLPAKSNCIWWSLLTVIEKKAFDGSVAAYQVLGNVLICSNNKSTSGIAAATGVIAW